MAEQTIFTCDVCGEPKGEANHWFKVRVYADKSGILVRIWASVTAVEDLHLCGAECVAKKVSEFVGGKV